MRVHWHMRGCPQPYCVVSLRKRKLTTRIERTTCLMCLRFLVQALARIRREEPGRSRLRIDTLLRRR